MILASLIHVTKMKGVTMKRKGFSLIELLVVVTIMGILMAIAAANYGAIIGRSRVKGAADKISRELLSSRERAFSRGQVVSVVFGTTAAGGLKLTVAGEPEMVYDDCRVGLVSTGAPTSKAPNCSTSAGAPPAGGIDFASNTCQFVPQGVGSAGAVYIKSINDKIQYAVGINANGKVGKFLWTGSAWQ
jgi:prepilin-type N-terminal cleavage/methylation domain-containing protein